MINKLIYNVIGIISLLIVSAHLSCNKFVEVPLPKDQSQTSTVFSNTESATAAVIGLYAQMQTTNLAITNGGLTIYGGLSADELKNTAASIDLDAFYNNNIPANNTTGILSRLWTAAYKYIYHSNLIIEAVDNSSTLPDSVATSLKAEAAFIRGFIYHYLYQLFGDVPLILSTDYRISAAMERTPIDDVKKQVLHDLTYAYNHLPAKPFANKARPCKFTTAALLARYYLYEALWQQAFDKANEVINCQLFELEPVLTNVFLLQSKETIWQLPKATGNTVEGTTFIPATGASARPAYELVPSLIQSFPLNDKRLGAWIVTKTVTGQRYYYPFKYKQRVSSPVTEGYIVMRLAEQYLIRSEAAVKLSQMNVAIRDLNIVRSRAGLQPFTSEDASAITDSLLLENRRELFTEWGHRWLNLKRTGKVNDVLSVVKPFWANWAALYPIPEAEILKNPNLIQNPHY